MNDTGAIYRAYLAAQSGITAITTTARIYAGGLPDGKMPSAGQTLVFRHIPGGRSNQIAPLQTLDFEKRCWAETELEAWALYRAVYDAVHGKSMQTQDGVRIHWIVESFPGVLERDTDTGWWYVLTEYQVAMAL